MMFSGGDDRAVRVVVAALAVAVVPAAGGAAPTGSAVPSTAVPATTANATANATNATDVPPFFTELELDIAGGPTVNVTNPWVFERQYNRTIEGLAPPVWVVVYPDNADFDATPPADQPKQAYELDNGSLVPINEGTEPTNDVYLVIKPGAETGTVKFLRGDLTKDSRLVYNCRGLISNTDAATIPQTFEVSTAVGPRPAPLPGAVGGPTDPDGDGKYEDVTGDGEFDVIDVATLLDAFEGICAENAPGVDFNDDGTVNIVDVAILLAET